MSAHLCSLKSHNPSPGAANRFPDKVDKDPEGTRKLNIEASKSLAKQCAERGIVLVYISTDYVFSGKEGEAPYEADAQTGPTNLYGQTKLDGEQAETTKVVEHAQQQPVQQLLKRQSDQPDDVRLTVELNIVPIINSPQNVGEAEQALSLVPFSN